MTLGDLLDQVARSADDDSGEYRTAARRWLNLVRSEIHSMARWRDAMRVATFTTSAATVSGLYALSGYEHLVDDTLYDETNDFAVRHESQAALNAVDAAKGTFGTPLFWGDAATDANDNRQIYLWPIPNGTYTLRFLGYLVINDVTEADDTSELDPFFGKVGAWAACFSAGLRYYHDADNSDDENPLRMQLQRKTFERMVADRMRVNMVAPVSSSRLERVRGAIDQTPGRGLFDPAHYPNP